jgi:hypothetical protein
MTQDAVENIDTSQLKTIEPPAAVDAPKDNTALNDAFKALNEITLEFIDRRLTLAPDQVAMVPEISRLMNVLIASAKANGQTVTFEVGTHLLGQFDRGSNAKLLKDRYNVIVSTFESEGIPSTYFTYNKDPMTPVNKPAAVIKVLMSKP